VSTDTETEAARPRTGGRGTKAIPKAARSVEAAAQPADTRAKAAKRRPPRPSARALRVILDDLNTVKARLQAATDELRGVDARIHSWDRSEAFLARRAHALHDEATARFAAALDELHAFVARLADRADATFDAAFSPRLRAAGTRRLQARVRSELRGLQRAFQGGGALLARSLEAFDA
jgi:hypothetical protein